MGSWHTVLINPCLEEPEQLGVGENFCTVLVKEVTMQAEKQSSGRHDGEEEEEAEFDEDLFHQQGHPRTTLRGCRLMRNLLHSHHGPQSP